MTASTLLVIFKCYSVSSTTFDIQGNNLVVFGITPLPETDTKRKRLVPFRQEERNQSMTGSAKSGSIRCSGSGQPQRKSRIGSSALGFVVPPLFLRPISFPIVDSE